MASPNVKRTLTGISRAADRMGNELIASKKKGKWSAKVEKKTAMENISNAWGSLRKR